MSFDEPVNSCRPAVQPETRAPRDGVTAARALSEGQKGLWLLHELAPDSSAYNVPLCFRISTSLDVRAFERACELLLVQHPLLASVIMQEAGVAYLCSTAPAVLSWSHRDIAGYSEQELLEYLRSRAKEPFALDTGPLMRVELLSRSPHDHVALIVVHHIVFDGSSVPLLLEELCSAYEALVRGDQPTVTPLAATYQDFVEWEQAMLASPRGQAHRAYWLQQLAGPLPV